MLTLRCTQRLLKRLKRKPEIEPTASTTRLGDWYGNLLYVGKKQLALFVSERSLLPVLIPARELSDLPAALISELSELLGPIGVPRAAIESEVIQMRELSFAATTSRSVLGSMNDMAWAVKVLLSDSPEMRLLDLAMQLGDTPYSALKYRFPREVAAEFLIGRK